MSIEPFINSKISIVTNADVRYQGILYRLNVEDATLVIQDCKCFGTRGRANPKIPESLLIEDYQVFKGADIKDLTILEYANGNKENVQQLKDPAICKTLNNSNEIQRDYGVPHNMHAKCVFDVDVLESSISTSLPCAFDDALLNDKPYIGNLVASTENMESLASHLDALDFANLKGGGNDKESMANVLNLLEMPLNNISGPLPDFSFAFDDDDGDGDGDDINSSALVGIDEAGLYSSKFSLLNSKNKVPQDPLETQQPFGSSTLLSSDAVNVSCGKIKEKPQLGIASRLQHVHLNKDSVNNTSEPQETIKHKNTEASATVKHTPYYDKNVSFYDNLTHEIHAKPPRHLFKKTRGGDKQKESKSKSKMSTSVAMDMQMKTSKSPRKNVNVYNKESSMIQENSRRGKNFSSRKWQRELDAVTFGKDSLKQLPRHFYSSRRIFNNHQHRQATGTCPVARKKIES